MVYHYNLDEKRWVSREDNGTRKFGNRYTDQGYAGILTRVEDKILVVFFHVRTNIIDLEGRRSLLGDARSGKRVHAGPPPDQGRGVQYPHYPLSRVQAYKNGNPPTVDLTPN